MLTPTKPSALDVVFREHTLDEELLYFIRRCARHYGPVGGVCIVSRHAELCEVRLMLGDTRAPTVVERDPDAFLAVRNVFGRLGSQRTAHMQTRRTR